MSIGMMGFDGFIWFTGVVEDRNDPEQLGRYRVRCVGIHTDDKSVLPTRDLPWAMPMMPLTSASVSEVGQTPSLVEGSWVVGFFRDGESCQEPVIMGSLPGKPYGQVNQQLGFNSNADSTTDAWGPFPRYAGDVDTPRSARGGVDSVPLATRMNGVNQGHRDNTPAEEDETGRGLKSVNPKPIAWGGSWEAFPVNYNAQYPYCHTTQTESGHLFELDDTPGAERVLLMHRKDTFVEMDAEGNFRIHAYGVGEVLVDLELNVECKGNVNIYSHGKTTVYAEDNIDMQSDKDVRIRCKNFRVEAEDNIDEICGGTMKLDAGSNIDADAPRIDLN